MSYHDLTLSLRRLRDDHYAYTVEVSLRYADDSADTLFTPGELPQIRIDFDLLRALELDSAAYGRELRDMLFVDPVRAAFQQAHAHAAGRGAKFRVCLRLDSSDDAIHSVRWERIYHKDDALALSERVLFSRHLGSAEMAAPPRRPRGRSALVAIANPAGLHRYGLAEIDIPAEEERLRQALGGIRTEVLASRPSRRRASLANLLEALRDGGGYDILYLVCHGTSVGRQHYLWLEREDGEIDRVSGQIFADRLTSLEPQHMPNLVILTACEGAGAGDAQTSLAGVGPKLAAAGIPAVLAMQGKILKETVDQLIPRFIREIARDGQADRALAAARKTITNDQWWVPVLFLRARDGRIWDAAPDARPPSPISEAEIDSEALQRAFLLSHDGARTPATLSLGSLEAHLDDLSPQRAPGQICDGMPPLLVFYEALAAFAETEQSRARLWSRSEQLAAERGVERPRLLTLRERLGAPAGPAPSRYACLQILLGRRSGRAARKERPGRQRCTVDAWLIVDEQEPDPLRRSRSLDDVIGEQRELPLDGISPLLSRLIRASRLRIPHPDRRLMVEFFLPLDLANLAVDSWEYQKKESSALRTPLGVDFPVVVRLLDWIREKPLHNEWRHNWQELRERGFHSPFFISRPEQFNPRLRYKLDESARMVVATIVPPHDLDRESDLLTALDETTSPAALWTRSPVDAERLKALLAQLLAQIDPLDLPEQLHRRRLRAHSADSPEDIADLPELGSLEDLALYRDVSLFWNDPHRLPLDAEVNTLFASPPHR